MPQRVRSKLTYANVISEVIVANQFRGMVITVTPAASEYNVTTFEPSFARPYRCVTAASNAD